MFEILERANKLERVLRDYLQCNYTDFGVKANGRLDTQDWLSPVNFALGFKYAESGSNSDVKEWINDFLGNRFYGLNMNDLVSNFDEYGFKTKEKALEYIDDIIEELTRILDY